MTHPSSLFVTDLSHGLPRYAGIPPSLNKSLMQLAHILDLKGQLSLLIFFRNFLNVFNDKSYLRVYCLYVGIYQYVFVCLCAYVCMGSCKCWSPLVYHSDVL